jgi:hypothetical protein
VRNESSFHPESIGRVPKPAGATEERLLSSSWDAFQSKTIRKGPLIENCETRNAGDDIASAKSVGIRNNRFISAQHDPPPDTGASYSIPANPVIWATECGGITLEKNVTEDTGPFAGKPIQASKGIRNAKGFE